MGSTGGIETNAGKYLSLRFNLEMNKSLVNPDFDSILLLITDARNRVYVKANAELVLLYFNVGKIISEN